MSKPKTKHLIFWIATIALTIAICAAAYMLLSRLNVFRQNYANKLNTQINGINLSGLSSAEAYTKVASYIADKTDDFSLTLKNGDQIYEIDHNDYTINPDIRSILDLATTDNQYAAELQKLQLLSTSDGSTTIAFNYIFQGIDDRIDEICKEIETPAVDSTITFNPNGDNMWDITAASDGKIINRTKLYSDINKQFLNNNHILIDLELEDSAPIVTEQYNQSLTNRIAKFSTSVSDSTGGRKNNVKLALSKFNGMRVDPGQTISFNDITSPHTIANGYQVATIIQNGRFVDGVGGGVCQASTTLYNALLLSGVTIDEVHKHTLPVRYVPLALDAMVSGNSDLVFTNTLPNPIFIKTSSTADDVTVEIFSAPLDVEYSTESETLATLSALPDKIIPDTNKEYTDHVIFKGETYRLSYPRGGYDVKSYLITSRNGEVVDRKEIRHEIYQPQAGIVIEGVEEVVPDMPIIEDETPTLNMDNNFLFDTIPTYVCP